MKIPFKLASAAIAITGLVAVTTVLPISARADDTVKDSKAGAKYTEKAAKGDTGSETNGAKAESGDATSSETNEHHHHHHHHMKHHHMHHGKNHKDNDEGTTTEDTGKTPDKGTTEEPASSPAAH